MKGRIKFTTNLMLGWFGTLTLIGLVQLTSESVDKIAKVIDNNRELITLVSEIIKKDGSA